MAITSTSYNLGSSHGVLKSMVVASAVMSWGTVAQMSNATVIDEKVLNDCLKEISCKLLQADVQFKMVRDVQANIKSMEALEVCTNMCRIMQQCKRRAALLVHRGSPATSYSDSMAASCAGFAMISHIRAAPYLEACRGPESRPRRRQSSPSTSAGSLPVKLDAKPVTAAKLRFSSSHARIQPPRGIQDRRPKRQTWGTALHGSGAGEPPAAGVPRRQRFPLGIFFRRPKLQHAGSPRGAFSHVCSMRFTFDDACDESNRAGHPYPASFLGTDAYDESSRAGRPYPASFPGTLSFFFFLFILFSSLFLFIPYSAILLLLRASNPVHPGANPTGADLPNSSPPGFRQRALSCIVGDEISTHTSVAWCAFYLWLSRPSFNRRMARFFHPAVLAPGDISAYCRRVRPRLCHSLCCNSVGGPSCNAAFFEGLYCNLLA